MSGFLALKQQDLLSTKAKWMSLVWAVDQGHVDVWRLCRTGLTPHLGTLGELDLGVTKANLTLPLTIYSPWESRPAHCWNCKWASPKDMPMRDVALPLIAHVVAWMNERCPPPFLSLATVAGYPSPATALWRASPVPNLVCTVKLILMVGARMNRTWRCEHERARPVNCLPGGVMGKGEMIPSCYLWQAEELAMRSSEWESWPFLSPGQHSRDVPGYGACKWASPEGHSCGRSGTASCLLGSGTNERDRPLSPPSTITIYGRQEKWPRIPECGRSSYDPHLMQHLGDLVLHLTWAAG